MKVSASTSSRALAKMRGPCAVRRTVLRHFGPLALAIASIAAHGQSLIQQIASSKKPVNSSPAANEPSANYEIGDRRFEIPLSYIRPGETKRGGNMSGVNLRALLPDFQGYNPSTRYEFDKSNSQRLMNIRLSVHDTKAFGRTFPLMSRAAIYSRITHDPRTGRSNVVKESRGPFGLTVLTLSAPNSARELFVGAKPNGESFWALCSRSSAINPRCDAQMEYSAHVTVAYHFPRDLLSRWRELDGEVLGFVRQLEE
jgi:hypothetical protein